MTPVFAQITTDSEAAKDNLPIIIGGKKGIKIVNTPNCGNVNAFVVKLKYVQSGFLSKTRLMVNFKAQCILL